MVVVVVVCVCVWGGGGGGGGGWTSTYSHISRMQKLIHMELKDEIAVFHEWEGQSTCNKRDVSW